MRAAIYCRVSTDGQEDNTSLASQEASCRAYAAQHGLSVVSVETDTYTGSRYRERPGLSRLRALIRARQVDVVICHAIDRFSRNQAHLYILLEELNDAGVKVAFVTEVLEDSAIGRFIQSARAFAAEVEREKTSERTTRGKRTKLLQGTALRPPKDRYGFVWDAATSTFSEHPTEADVARQLFEYVATNRVSARAAMRWINTTGIPAPDGAATWSLSRVQRLLREPAYKGVLYAWRFQQTRVGNSVTTRRRPESEWIELPAGTAPVIVDEATWQTVQTVLDSGNAARRRNELRPFLLRGMVACSCGANMSPNPRSSTTTVKHDYYRCNSRMSSPTLQACGGPMVRVDALDEWAWEIACRSIGGETLASVAREQEPIVDLRQQRIDQLQAQVDTITKQQERILGEFRRSASIPWSLVEGEIQRAEAERLVLLERIGALSLELQAITDTAAENRTLLTWAQSVRERLDVMSFEERRHALETINVRITIHGRHVSDWEYEDDL